MNRSELERDASDGIADGLPVPVSIALAASAYVVPFALSRSTTPSPDHPRVFLWYRHLRKPWFKPPDVVIPLAWFGIETGLAIGGYRLSRKPASVARNRALALLAGNIVGIGGWSFLFFGRRDLPIATAAAAALGVGAAAYVHEARKVDRVAAEAAVPMVAWVAFATLLTAAIWRRNR